MARGGRAGSHKHPKASPGSLQHCPPQQGRETATQLGTDRQGNWTQGTQGHKPGAPVLTETAEQGRATARWIRRASLLAGTVTSAPGTLSLYTIPSGFWNCSGPHFML